jgi:hypothetical protein
VAKIWTVLITASGFIPVNVGGIDQPIRIEVFGDLREFGKLGKLVSAPGCEHLKKVNRIRPAFASPNRGGCLWFGDLPLGTGHECLHRRCKRRGINRFG